MEWLISILAGAIGGTLVGRIFYKNSLGRFMNSVTGAVGGILSQSTMSSLSTLFAADPQIRAGISAFIFGGLLTLVAGLVKKASAQS